MKKILFFIIYVLTTQICHGQPLKDTLVDIDGNVYHTVKIGTQIWTVENLKVTHFRNGDSITNLANGKEWGLCKTAAYCNLLDSVSTSEIYGRLYNWYALSDPRFICPEGWHIPSDEEWNVMEKYLDNSTDTTSTGVRGANLACKLKDNTGSWSQWNQDHGSTNESGFTALPNCQRDYFGKFKGLYKEALFWTSTSYNNDFAFYRLLSYLGNEVDRNFTNKNVGAAIRLVKD